MTMSRSTAATALAIAALGLLPGAASAFPATQAGVRIDSPANVRAKPASDGKRITGIDYLTPLRGTEMVLPALARRRSADGYHWVKVRLPRRPNGSTGWVREDLTTSLRLEWRIRVSLRSRRATV